MLRCHSYRVKCKLDITQNCPDGICDHVSIPQMLALQAGMERDLGAQRDRQIRLHSVHTDLELDLPPSIALPDGEEIPYGSSTRLHIRDSEQRCCAITSRHPVSRGDAASRCVLDTHTRLTLIATRPRFTAHSQYEFNFHMGRTQELLYMLIVVGRPQELLYMLAVVGRSQELLYMLAVVSRSQELLYMLAVVSRSQELLYMLAVVGRLKSYCTCWCGGQISRVTVHVGCGEQISRVTVHVGCGEQTSRVTVHVGVVGRSQELLYMLVWWADLKSYCTCWCGGQISRVTVHVGCVGRTQELLYMLTVVGRHQELLYMLAVAGRSQELLYLLAVVGRPQEESEIYQKCIRAPPNRTVFDGESPPPYRSSSAGLLSLSSATSSSSSSSGEWTTSVVRCHSMSSRGNVILLKQKSREYNTKMNIPSPISLTSCDSANTTEAVLDPPRGGTPAPPQTPPSPALGSIRRPQSSLYLLLTTKQGSHRCRTRESIPSL
ncbi:hypothetical protein J6590_004239 [Homalodisca vitripennis]|nr:hypothetical protein J6590_004239 [Homalodisca vitripennis]